jgi:two-component system sensor kinase FixL
LSVSPIFDANGVVIGASKSARDISERVMLNQRLDQLQAELLHVSRVNDMGQMATAIAHELKQPLTAIAIFLGAARIHLERGDTVLALEGCRKADAEVMRAAAILGRLSDFMKKDQIHLRRESLDGVLDDAITLAQLGPNAKSVKIEVRIGDGAEAALVDRVQIQQVLVNLIRNAAEAMQGRSVKSVLISTRREDDDMIAVEVADSGPGLAADVLAHLFEPFQTTKADGMGIGLSLCRRIVRSHGGEISAGNADEGGAVFRFTLIAA